MNGDLISREALKKEIKKSVPYVEQERILDLIDNVPTIAEDYDTGYQDGLEDGLNDIRPQGEWIAIEPYTHETFCPFCKEDTKDEVYGNFCPNCGANMQKGGAE